MAVFTTASVLGIQSRGEFLGQDVARYRTVKTFDIEGFIDSRGNVSGIADTQRTINSYVSAASASDNIMESISINGKVYGTGRIVSLNFRAAENTLNSQIMIGQYSAQIEMYESGDLNNVFGATASSKINNSGLQFIQDISEDFSFNRSEGDEYDYSHNVNITFISGVTGSAAGETIDPFNSAYNVAQVLFDNRPNDGFDILGNLNYKYDSKGLAYYTETKDKIKGACSFSKQLSLYPSGLTSGDYSARITNSFEIDSQGIGYVTEKGEILGRDDNSQHNALKNAAQGVETEIGQSYRRCSGIYDTYKGYIDNVTDVYLYSGATQRDITSNPNVASREYSVRYTDDEAYQNVSYIWERDQSFVEQADGSVVASEQGTITSRSVKGTSPSWPIFPEEAAMKTRLEGFYTKSKHPMGTALSLINSSVSIPKYGKALTYNYQYSDSDEVNLTVAQSNLFNKISVIVSNNLGGAVGKTTIVPNRKEGSALYQGPLQTSLATRDVTIDYQLKRENGKGWTDFLQLHKYYGLVRQQLVLETYNVFKDFPEVFALDPNEMFVSDVKISLKSTRTLQVTMQVTYPMQRPHNKFFAAFNK